MSDNNNIVGFKIKGIRESKNLTIEEISERSGLSTEQIASIENNTPRRTSDRPARNQANGREKPAIRDGLEGRSREEGRPANGQRSTGNRQPGQRPADAQGQRPMKGQPGQRTVDAQGQRPMNGQPGQRPVDAQGQRPMGGQPQQRPVNGPQGQPQAAPNRPKNFVQNNDDMEYEFLNWDSDE